MYNAPALKKALDIIKFIVKENKPLGVTEIARALSLSKSTTFGILKSLEEEGFATKIDATKKYMAGSELFELSKRVLRATDLTTVARSFLEKLVELVDESVFLGVREDDTVKVLDVVEPKRELKISSPVGARLRLVSGVVGKIFLSTFDNEQLRNFLAANELRKYTENSITDVEKYIAEIDLTRARGYALDFDEEYLKGIRAVSTLIYSGRFPIGALWVVGFTSSLSDDKLPHVITHLKQTAQEISLRLSPYLSDGQPVQPSLET
jgi:IclR family transcriptional regulator, KDG regulon repressor